jgi:hypothetical protein
VTDPCSRDDRSPDELLWKHLKADTVGRMAITDKADFKTKVRSSMRQMQNDPEKIRSFYRPSNTPREIKLSFFEPPIGEVGLAARVERVHRAIGEPRTAKIRPGDRRQRPSPRAPAGYSTSRSAAVPAAGC